MVYEAVEVNTATGTEEIIVDTDSTGRRFQVIRLDLGVDTATQPVNGTLPISAASLPLPSGAATSALQTTGNTHLATLAGAVSGGQVQVDIVSGSTAATEYTEGSIDATISGPAIMWEDTSDTLRAVSAAKPLPVVQTGSLPAGTNAIGKLSANSGVDIGDADITSVTPGFAATNLAKRVGDVAGSTDVGPAFLLRRTDALATLSDADGDYVLARGDSMGRLHVNSSIATSSGEAITFDPVREVVGTPTLGTGGNVQLDSLHITPLTMAVVVNGNGETGHILGATLTSRHNTFAGKIKAYLFNETVTGTTAQDPLSVSDTDIEKSIGTLEFDFSTSSTAASRVANANRSDLPIPFKCSAGTDDIYIILQLWSADTPTFGASDFKLKLLVQPD